jgi:hypothetical protein
LFPHQETTSTLEPKHEETMRNALGRNATISTALLRIRCIGSIVAAPCRSSSGRGTRTPALPTAEAHPVATQDPWPPVERMGEEKPARREEREAAPPPRAPGRRGRRSVAARGLKSSERSTAASSPCESFEHASEPKPPPPPGAIHPPVAHRRRLIGVATTA